MRTEMVAGLSDVELVARLEELWREERRVTAVVLEHLGEVEARRLYVPAACSSMHAYCTRVLGMSEDGAFKRIRAARAVRRFPVVGAAVAAGRLHLAERIERVAEQTEMAAVETEMAAADAGQVAPGPAGRAAKVAPLSPERFALQVTIGEETRSKLARAQALLRHRVPSGDLAEVLDRALDALLEKLEARKFGTAKRPRAAKASGRGRYVPREARRQAVARDGARCSFVAADGRRCEETGFLELDHVVPVAQGGDASKGLEFYVDRTTSTRRSGSSGARRSRPDEPGDRWRRIWSRGCGGWARTGAIERAGRRREGVGGAMARARSRTRRSSS